MASQHPDIEKVLFTQEDIDGIVSRLGEEITRDYAGKDLVLIAVLRGAVVFMGDLMRKIELPTNIDFMAVSSYGDGVKSSGIVRIIKAPGYRHPWSRRADRRGHSGLGPDPQVPDEEPQEPQARFAGGRCLPVEGR